MRSVIILLISCFITSNLLAQNAGEKKINEVDPRQYLEIYEDTEEPSQPILVWDFDTIQRKVEAVHENSILRVTFDKKLLSENPDFIGNFSIRAQVNDRVIQVTPYSVLGQSQYKVGFQANSARQNALHFLSMMIETNSIDTVWERYLPIYTDRSRIFLNQKVNEVIEYYSRVAPDSETNILEKQHRTLYNKLSNISMYVPGSSVLAVYLKKPLLFKNREILSELSEIRRNIQTNQITGEINPEVKIDGYKALYQLVDYALSYYQNFNEAGLETNKAYLSLIQRDNIFLSNIMSRLKKAHKKLDILDTLQRRGFDKFKKQLKKAALESHVLLEKLSDIRGTQLAQILKKHGFRNLRDISRKEKDAVVQELLESTGREVFKRLVYASINLDRGDVEKGDKLSIYIKWYIGRNTNDYQSNVQPLELHIATYKVD